MPFIVYQMNNRAHIHDVDCAWMKWLRTCSKIKGSSGNTLYDEYTRHPSQWRATMHKLTTEVYPCWPFCRGDSALSSVDIASARIRYLDMYPLTREQQDSAAYVDGLLEVDRAQVDLRCKRRPQGSCVGCIERDRTLALMRTALSRAGIDGDAFEVEVAAAIAIFQRYFIVEPGSATARNEVRTTIEKVLQREVGPDESLAQAGDVWKACVRRVLGVNCNSSATLRCRPRVCPLEAHEVAVEDL